LDAKVAGFVHVSPAPNALALETFRANPQTTALVAKVLDRRRHAAFELHQLAFVLCVRHRPVRVHDRAAPMPIRPCFKKAGAMRTTGNKNRRPLVLVAGERENRRQEKQGRETAGLVRNEQGGQDKNKVKANGMEKFSFLREAKTFPIPDYPATAQTSHFNPWEQVRRDLHGLSELRTKTMLRKERLGANEQTYDWIYRCLLGWLPFLPFFLSFCIRVTCSFHFNLIPFPFDSVFI
jgi:hypothetical protein